MKILVNRSVEVYETARNSSNSTTCKAEWEPYGTCCNREQLIEAYLKDSKAIDDHAAELKVVWAKLIHLYELSKVHIPFNETDFLTEKEHFSLVFTHHTYSEVVGTSIDRCWNHLKKLRGTSLCSICSGRSQNYFCREKSLIDLATCQDSINHCEDFFRRFNGLMNSITKSIQYLKKILEHRIQDAKLQEALLSGALDQKHNPNILLEQAKRIEYQLELIKLSKTLMEKFDAYDRDTKSNSNTTLLISGEICTSITAIIRSPYITDIKTGLLNTAINTLTGDGSNRALLSLRFAPSRNLAFSLASSSDPLGLNAVFHPDSMVLLKQQDNMFTAYDGAQGTTLGVLGTVYSPMNMTMQFP